MKATSEQPKPGDQQMIDKQVDTLVQGVVGSCFALCVQASFFLTNFTGILEEAQLVPDFDGGWNDSAWQGN
jgi:hypothetical protein